MAQARITGTGCKQAPQLTLLRGWKVGIETILNDYYVSIDTDKAVNVGSTDARRKKEYLR